MIWYNQAKSKIGVEGFTYLQGGLSGIFAPVAKMNSIRILLSCVANLEWELCQLDVKSAFLHGDLEEEVYMDGPPSFSCQKIEGNVCKLKKTLYGLKNLPEPDLIGSV